LYATRQDTPLRNLMLMATPVDFDEMGLLAGLAREGRINPVELLGPDGNVPPDVIRSAFKLRRPTAEVVKYVNLWENLWNDEYVEGYQAMNRWANDHIPFPGAAAIQMVKLFIREKRLVAGSIRLGNRTMKLKAITCPVIHVMAEKDDIVPIAAAAPLLGLLGSRDKTELRLPAGHVAMVAGRSAVKTNIPRVIEWMDGHSLPVSRRRK
ncbi:MAG TPA: alpha/beta hydrolase, partial [Candidatus Dormibacteraeota bacterium]|nr:alpha/beta hydrolase [Candidatus Dormibacteraeota bacterium]